MEFSAEKTQRKVLSGVFLKKCSRVVVWWGNCIAYVYGVIRISFSKCGAGLLYIYSRAAAIRTKFHMEDLHTTLY